MADRPGRSLTSPPRFPDYPAPSSNGHPTDSNPPYSSSPSPSQSTPAHHGPVTTAPGYPPQPDYTSSGTSSNSRVEEGTQNQILNQFRFTTGEEDNREPGTEEASHRHEKDLAPPQTPPLAHPPLHPPSYLEAELLPEYGSAHHILNERAQSNAPQTASAIQSGDQIEGQDTHHKGRSIQLAVERAQNLASQLRRSSHFRRRKKSQDEAHTGSPPRQGNPSSSGDAVISMDVNGGKRPNMDVDADRERRYSARVMEANELVDGMKNITSDVPQPKSQWPHTEDIPPYENAVHEGPSDTQHRVHRPSILANLLSLQNREKPKDQETTASNHNMLSPCDQPSARSSSKNTVRSKPRWYDKSNRSSCSLNSMNSDTTLSGETEGGGGGRKRSSSSMFANTVKRFRKKGNLEDEIRITVHIAEIISRQRYLERLCEALMAYGAPTHRLEECMRMTSKVLDLESQFLYLPGCMFVSFDDPSTHTTDLRMRRYAQGVDLGRLEDVHNVYKQVIYDMIGVEEAIQQLDEIEAQKSRYNALFLILFYGFASASVGPFAFNARAIDIPIAFLLGCLLGVLKYLAVPRFRLYANVFELTAALLTSFLARAFGSIRRGDERLFCFPALAQSSIALILPGFMVLCSSLELQSQNILAGSVRLVFAIIYSLVLGFGIMLGTSFYGRMDPNASSAYTCPTNSERNEYAHNFPSVIAFTICMCAINQAKLTQMPAMVVISFTGYIVNFFSSRLFPSNMQVANAMGAFAIGIMGNLYSRIGRGLAATAMLPAILVQVPSGLAASGSIVSGLAFANELTQNSTNTTAVKDEGSAEVINAIQSSGALSGGGGDAAGELASRIGSNKVYGNIVFELAYAMIQVSISTTVGLFLAVLIVYPEGKRRSELFSF